jgi:hypothetical protein
MAVTSETLEHASFCDFRPLEGRKRQLSSAGAKKASDWASGAKRIAAARGTSLTHSASRSLLAPTKREAELKKWSTAAAASLVTIKCSLLQAARPATPTTKIKRFTSPRLIINNIIVLRPGSCAAPIINTKPTTPKCTRRRRRHATFTQIWLIAAEILYQHIC